MKKMTIEEHYMKEAIRQAKKAAALKEVPIGCVIVHDGKIIARGYNRRTVDKNVLAHAEIIAMRKACRILGADVEDADEEFLGRIARRHLGLPDMISSHRQRLH